MTSIPLHATSRRVPVTKKNPLPQLLQTPSGLALLEMQGTINLPEHDDEDAITTTDHAGGIAAQETPIGRLIFAEYDAQDPTSTAWMKRVYLYVGKHQRLSGEVKKLPKAIAVIRKRVEGLEKIRSDDAMDEGEGGEIPDELEVVEIVKWKILFSTRPEPVGTRAAAAEPAT
ncbi:sister chromatid cohesion protein (Ctf8) [Phlyctema vagabunda]|uniref:Sister chromatid cohesion protein (Ctf8) n=1 Tax=Phlyctema vagabunda TaxID=108571 RepID=A0ABR4PUQ2_9HELO